MDKNTTKQKPFHHQRVKPKLVIPFGHSRGITSVCISGDGCYALSGSQDRTLKLWDFKSGKEIRSFVGHKKFVLSVCFSPNGEYAFSGNCDQSIKLWDVRSGQEIRSFLGHIDVVYSVCISWDGRFLLSGSMDHTVKIWEVDTGQELLSFLGHSGTVYSACFSPDGLSVLSASEDKTIKLWDALTGLEIRTLKGHTDSVGSICFSPDGQYGLSGSKDGTLKLWNILTGKQIHSFNGHVNWVNSVCFSPDGRYALSGGEDRIIKLWDILTGCEIRSFVGHPDSVSSICFSPDGENILSAGYKESLKIWDVNTGKVVRTFERYMTGVLSACFSPDGQYILSDCEGTTLWNFYTGEMVCSDVWEEPVKSVCFSPNGSYALSVAMVDPRLLIWNIDTYEQRSFGRREQGLSSACYSPDGKYVLSGGHDCVLKLWDVNTGKKIRTFDGHQSPVRAVCITPDGCNALSGSKDGNLKLWDIQKGREILSFVGHTNSVNSICSSPDGKYVLTGGGDCTLRLWDALSGKGIRTFVGHNYSVNSVCFSSNGKYLLSGSSDRSLKLWDINTSHEIQTFNGHSDSVTSVCFSPNGDYILSASFDDTIKVWSAHNGKEIASLISMNSNDWVITSPSGHFDASVGALRKIHYSIGLEIINFDQLIGRYHIPGLLRILLRGSREDLPKVPPIENILLHPSMNARIESNTLVLDLENRGGGIGKVLVYAEEMEIIEDAREDSKIAKTLERLTISVNLLNYQQFFNPSEQNTLTIFCENANGTLRSKPVQLSYTLGYLVSKGGTKKKSEVLPMEADSPDPVKLHGVFIGSNTYGLEWAGSDAEAMADIVLSSGKKLYGDHVETSVFSGENFTKDEVLKQFGHMSEYLTRQDIVVIFLSGHAATDGKFNEYYFLLKENKTVESMGEILKKPSMRTKCTLSLKELRRAVNKIPARKKILILDTCNSGRVADHFGRVKSADIETYSQEKILKEVRNSTGFCILSSCAKDQKESYEKGRFKHGLMTYSILNGISTGDGLLKKSDNREYIEPVTLFNYVKVKTEKLAISANQSQVPNIYMPKSLDLLIGEVTEEGKKSIQISLLPLFTWSSIVSSNYNDVLDIEKKTDQLLKRYADLNYLEFTNRKDQPDVNQIMGTYRIEAETLIIQYWIKKGGQTVEGSKSDMIIPLAEAEKAAYEIVQVLRNFVSNH